MRYFSMIIALVISLAVIGGCSTQEQSISQKPIDAPDLETDAATVVAKPGSQKELKGEEPIEFKPVWIASVVRGKERASIRQSYKGYTYENMLCATMDSDIVDYRHMGGHGDTHYYAEKTDTHDPPLRIWTGPSPDKWSGSLHLRERGTSIASFSKPSIVKHSAAGGNLELILEIHKGPYVVGTPYPALIKLKNTSNKDVTLWADGLVDFRIVDERGYTVWEQDQYGKKFSDYVIPKGGTHIMKPQEFYIHKAGVYRMLLRTNDGVQSEGKVVPHDPPKVKLEPVVIEVAKDLNATNPSLMD